MEFQIKRHKNENKKGTEPPTTAKPAEAASSAAKTNPRRAEKTHVVVCFYENITYRIMSPGAHPRILSSHILRES